jgi:glycosyltransferase involved in cell wall biosynthesis
VPHIVNTCHGLWATDQDRLVRRLVVWAVERFAAAFSDVELVQNEEDHATLRFLRVPRRKLILLGNGIRLDRFDPMAVPDARMEIRRDLDVPPDHFLIGFVGRLVEEKGVHAVLEVARRVTDLPIRFILVGPDDVDKRDAVTLGDFPANVMAVGMRDDVERWYAAFDLLVLPSHREGFPRAIMEAAAMGVPAIATDIRGCRQSVVDGITGILVPVGDTDALESEIRDLTSDRKRISMMADAARVFAGNTFDVNNQIRITLGVYSSLLNNRP